MRHSSEESDDKTKDVKLKAKQAMNNYKISK